MTSGCIWEQSVVISSLEFSLLQSLRFMSVNVLIYSTFNSSKWPLLNLFFLASMQTINSFLHCFPYFTCFQLSNLVHDPHFRKRVFQSITRIREEIFSLIMLSITLWDLSMILKDFLCHLSIIHVLQEKTIRISNSVKKFVFIVSAYGMWIGVLSSF